MRWHDQAVSERSPVTPKITKAQQSGFFGWVFFGWDFLG